MSSSETNVTIKFPALSADYAPRPGEGTRKDDSGPNHSDSPRSSFDSRWIASKPTRWNANGFQGVKHGRQASLSEAIKNIRTRSGSMSQNALEIADALKAPVSPVLVILFMLWYFASVMSSTSSKVVLKTFPKPVTLTVIQFAFVSGCCLLLSFVSSKFPSMRRHIPTLKNGIKYPTLEVIRTTLPITAFMIGGHILSSDAISRIDVSLVHTIKGLSPLITVAAYRFISKEKYPVATYLSLIPLTLGVILACSTNFSANFLGLISAFASAILFVTQNIVSKEIFNAAALAETNPRITKKPDKLNLLCYSSLLALIITAPIWLWVEGWHILVDFFSDASITLSNTQGSLDHGPFMYEYLFNGIFHFLQSLAAFQLLSMVSPVTYSVASLVKRVFVIVFSIVWFGSAITRIQGFGIALTFIGLYLYDRSTETKLEPRGRNSSIINNFHLLPLVEKAHESPPISRLPSKTQLYGNSLERSHQPYYGGRLSPMPQPSSQSNGWLPAGTRAEETWNKRDLALGVS